MPKEFKRKRDKDGFNTREHLNDYRKLMIKAEMTDKEIEKSLMTRKALIKRRRKANKKFRR